MIKPEDKDLPSKQAWWEHASKTKKQEYGHELFTAGWDAALAWLPVGIRQFRELEEALKREIEHLKEKIEELKSNARAD